MVYLPDHFNASNQGQVRDIIDRHPLSTLVTVGPHGPEANHIPLILEPDRGPHGTLIGHVARNNDMWRHGGTCLAIFHVADAYISPNWYPTKADTHEVVPTWNYQVVHARGPLRVIDDERWLRGAVGKLTRKMETLSSNQPWKMADAPRAFIDDLLANIVGIEIPVESMIGKAKMSQNRPTVDRQGAAAGLRATDRPNASAIADLIEAHNRND